MPSAIATIRAQLLPSPLDAQEIQLLLLTNLWHAQKALGQAKKEANPLHKKHLEMLLNEAHASNKEKKSQALTHLIHVEQNKWCYVAFHQHIKPKSQGGLAL